MLGADPVTTTCNLVTAEYDLSNTGTVAMLHSHHQSSKAESRMTT